MCELQISWWMTSVERSDCSTRQTTTPSLEVHLPGLRKPSAPFFEYNFSKTSPSLYLSKKLPQTCKRSPWQFLISLHKHCSSASFANIQTTIHFHIKCWTILLTSSTIWCFIDSLVCQTLAHKETKQNRAEFKCTERKGGPSTAGAPCTPAKPWAQCTQWTFLVHYVLATCIQFIVVIIAYVIFAIICFLKVLTLAAKCRSKL